MKRIGILGLAVLAIFVISAIATASASALPEFKPSTKNPFTAKQTSSIGTLENTKGEKIECTGGGGPGEIVNATLVGKVVVKFTGCTSSGFECKTSGASAGEIRTNTLKGELGETNKKSVLGLEPETSGGPEASFVCAGLVDVTVKGGVVCEAPTTKSSKTGKLICTGSTGKQAFTTYEGSESKKVTTKELIEERSGATLKSSENATSEITYEKAVEVT